jgi:hypothetical protein
MPETKAKRSTSARKAPAARAKPARAKRPSAVDRTAELSDDVLKSLESGQRAAIEAVGQFVDTVDSKLPSLGKQDPSRRQELIDGALEMADRFVQAQYDLIRKVVDSAGKALSEPAEGS